MRLEGIHHITAIIGDARANVAFYTGVLGLRLVAKTVNQDDPGVYHLFYADERGCAGSELTFFAYQGAVPGRPGAGMVHRIVWRVGSEASLRFWERRVGEAVDAARTDGGVRFADPERLEHELVVGDGRDEPLIAEHPEIPAEHALQGFAGVRAYSDDPGRSGLMLEEVLGARPVADCEWELRGDRRGSTIAYDPAPPEPGRQSAGIVHHVAWGTTVAEHPRWLEHLLAASVQSTPVIDRHYFHSIYFPGPSGVLFEIADDGPGFAVDGPLEELGSELILPPFLEPHRERIEAALLPIPHPRALR